MISSVLEWLKANPTGIVAIIGVIGAVIVAMLNYKLGNRSKAIVLDLVIDNTTIA